MYAQSSARNTGDAALLIHGYSLLRCNAPLSPQLMLSKLVPDRVLDSALTIRLNAMCKAVGAQRLIRSCSCSRIKFIGGDPERDCFADGMVEGIVTALSHPLVARTYLIDAAE